MHPNQQIIEAQTLGQPLVETQIIDAKVEYYLKTKSGTLVAMSDSENNARKFVKQRSNRHGSNIAVLDIFKVTTITEKL